MLTYINLDELNSTYMSNTGDGKKLATFNIEGEAWEAFKLKARDNGSNASALLNQWIRNYLDDLGEVPNTHLDATEVSNPEPIDDEALIDRLMPELTKQIKAKVEHDLGNLVNTLIDANLPVALEAHLGKA